MRTVNLIAPLAAFALAIPAFAGGAECEKAAAAAHTASAKCTASKEECAKYMAASRKAGWLGVEYDKSEAGTIAVKKIVPGSPAEKAGFQVGDVLVALNGVDIRDKEKVSAVKKDLLPGSTATYTVKRDGWNKELTAKLGTMPDAVYQAMYDEHMKEHVAVAAK
ncbi:MAG TPA: PDZ domain-containing protein [Candidatus Polarisedimenticolaceae bacterium]|nr:PDZ domain-containing protein [Candidatus Polarisedimenticolaceae bacterium]